MAGAIPFQVRLATSRRAQAVTSPIGFLQQKARGYEFGARIALQGLLLKLNSWRCDCGVAQGVRISRRLYRGSIGSDLLTT